MKPSFLTGKPILIIKPLTEQTVKKLPATVTFECTISKSGLLVDWYKNDQKLAKSKKYRFEEEGNFYRLVILDVSDEDDADFTIRVQDTDVKSTAGLFVEGEGYKGY
jgi:hypothetical protein